MEDLYSVTFNKIMQAPNYTIFVLGAKEKQFGIYTSPQTGDIVEKLLANKPFKRPQTHEFVESVFKGLNINPFQLVIHDVKDSIFFCKLFLSQTSENEETILQIDVRPSDGLVIALGNNLPIFCTKTLLDESPEYHE